MPEPLLRVRVLVAFTLLCACMGACSTAFGDKRAGEACTRSKQCAVGLTCLSGSCRASKTDAGAAGSAADASAGDDDDAGK